MIPYKANPTIDRYLKPGQTQDEFYLEEAAKLRVGDLLKRLIGFSTEDRIAPKLSSLTHYDQGFCAAMYELFCRDKK